MTNDDELKTMLQKETEQLDNLIHNDAELVGYLRTGFSTGMRGIMYVAYGCAILFSIALIWSAYQFFFAGTEEPVFWGVCLILSFQAQTTTKLWIYMQTNRKYQSEELRQFLKAAGKL
ncbi:hypothetical protein CWE09_09330 [Aliidiomarina minuta]|uniref:Uncharacterized protein n=1 Tax=Aliidiomarina minuta TaxID=880057 RepID=A0A432W9Z9_9GAMM|nr:DUF6768 family protein [Aliidiomarina minuta]RUO26871.1 hypothetical protein CWE09_09330 [Aliidiomarina minuta]